MVENLVNDSLVLDTGDRLGFTATLWAHRYVDIEHPFQALCPGHGLVALFGCSVYDFSTGAALSAFGRCHFNTVVAVGGKYAVEPCQVHSRLRRQRRQLSDEIQRIEDDVRGPVAVGRFELISDIARGCQ